MEQLKKPLWMRCNRTLFVNGFTINPSFIEGVYYRIIIIDKENNGVIFINEQGDEHTVTTDGWFRHFTNIVSSKQFEIV